MNSVKRALVLAPHPDDGEFGCGASLNKLIKKKVEVYYVAFSRCEISLPNGMAADTLVKELVAAAKVLGIKKKNIKHLNFDVRYFPKQRQEILEALIKIRNEIKPDLVFLPNSIDIHQDHGIIHQEGLRAFKYSNLLGYELPWNNLQSSKHNFFIEVTEANLKLKINALKAYRSQKFRNYLDPEFIKSLARVRGKQIGKDYAESFEAIRWKY